MLSVSPVPRFLRTADNTSFHSRQLQLGRDTFVVFIFESGRSCFLPAATKSPSPKLNLAFRDDQYGRLLIFTQSYANTSHSASLPPLKIGITGMEMQAIIYSKQCLCLVTLFPWHLELNQPVPS